MGYDTNFYGKITITPELTMAQVRAFRKIRPATGGTPRYDNPWDIDTDYEEDGTLYIPNGESVSDYVEWLEWLVENFFKPDGHVLNGEVQWQGEEHGDEGMMRVAHNVVTAKDVYTYVDELKALLREAAPFAGAVSPRLRECIEKALEWEPR